MLDQAFFDEFMATDPNAKGVAGSENKELYTRAEVDDIVQKTIKSTMDQIKKSMMQSNPEDPEEEKEENTNGTEESSGDAGESNTDD